MARLPGSMRDPTESAVVTNIFRSGKACAHRKSKFPQKNNMLQRATRALRWRGGKKGAYFTRMVRGGQTRPPRCRARLQQRRKLFLGHIVDHPGVAHGAQQHQAQATVDNFFVAAHQVDELLRAHILGGLGR